MSNFSLSQVRNEFPIEYISSVHLNVIEKGASSAVVVSDKNIPSFNPTMKVKAAGYY